MSSTSSSPIDRGGDSTAHGPARRSADRAAVSMWRTRWLIIVWYAFTMLVGATVATWLSLLAMASWFIIPAVVVAWLVVLAIVGPGIGAIRGVWRSRAYPRRYWSQADATICFTLVFTAILSLWARGCTPNPRWSPYEQRQELRDIRNEPGRTHGAAARSIDDAWAAIPVAVLWFWLLMSTFLVRGFCHDAQVTPYFESKVGEIGTYAHGKDLARHVLDLDELAQALGVTPLSDFGWNDDHEGEALNWHNSASGLKTVNALLAHLQGDEFGRHEHIGVIDDLKRIAHALGRADQQGIRFCLLLRHGNGTAVYPLEQESRKGSFF